MVVIFQEKLSIQSIRCIKSDKLRLINFDEFLDDFIMKKTRTKRFCCLLCYVQPYLIR